MRSKAERKPRTGALLRPGVAERRRKLAVAGLIEGARNCGCALTLGVPVNFESEAGMAALLPRP